MMRVKLNGYEFFVILTVLIVTINTSAN